MSTEENSPGEGQPLERRSTGLGLIDAEPTVDDGSETVTAIDNQTLKPAGEAANQETKPDEDSVSQQPDPRPVEFEEETIEVDDEPEVQHSQSQVAIEVDHHVETPRLADGSTAQPGGIVFTIPFDFPSAQQIYQSVACGGDDETRQNDDATGAENRESSDDGEIHEVQSGFVGPHHQNFFLSFSSIAQRVASYLPTEHLVRVFRTVHASCSDAGRVELEERRHAAVRKYHIAPAVMEFQFVDCLVRHYAHRRAVAVIISQKGEGSALIKASIFGPGVSRYLQYRGEHIPVSYVTGEFVSLAAEELPLLLDATIILQNKLEFQIGQGIAASPDLSHLLNLPTELSQKAWNREVVVCRLNVAFPQLARQPPLWSLDDTSSDDSGSARNGEDDDQKNKSRVSAQIELPVSDNLRCRAVGGAVPVPFVDLLTSKIVSAPGLMYPSRNDLLEQSVTISVMQEGSTHVLASRIGPFQLGATLFEVRAVLKSHPATAALEDRFSFCSFGSANCALGEVTERSSRQRSARSSGAGTGSIAGLAPTVTSVDENTLLLYDLLPPNNLQFLVGELRSQCYPRWTHLGWPAEVTLWNGKVLVVIVKAPQGNIIAQDDPTLTSSASVGGPSGTRAARSLRQQAQRQKELQSSRDALIALQALFAQGADCCRRGDVQGLSLLLDTKPQNQSGSAPSLVNLRSILGQSFAHVAAEHGRQEVIAALVARGINVALRDANGELPIHLCATKGFAECIPPLLRGAGGMQCIDAQDNAGRTPLICALQNGFLNTALWLVEQGANSLITESAGFSASDFACRLMPTISDICATGNVEAAKMLLSAACDDSPPEECTVVEASAWYTESLKHRLTRGRLLLDIDGVWTISKRQGTVVPNVLRITALHCAVRASSLALVQLLISRFPNSNVLAQDQAGDTALHCAARCNDAELMIYLLEHLEAKGHAMDGLAIQNASGRTAIHEALLLPHGAHHVSRILARCQAVPSLYPVERFGSVLVHYLERGTRLSACHFAVAHIHRRTSITPALLAAALAALDTPPSEQQDASLGSAPLSALQVAYSQRFPSANPSAVAARRQTAPGTQLRGEALPSLFAIAVQQGCTETLQLLVDFRADAINKGGVRWPTEYFGDFAPTELLRIAFDHGDLPMFQLLLKIVGAGNSCAVSPQEALRAHILNVSELRSNSAPLYHAIVCSPPSLEWVDTVLAEGALQLVFGDRSTASSPLKATLASVDEEDDVVSIFSRLVCVIVWNTKAARRSTRGEKPAPLPQAETTWSRFLTDSTSSMRRLRKEGGANKVVHHAFPVSSSREHYEKAAHICLEVLSKVCQHVADGFNDAHSQQSRERHAFRRQVLFATLRCEGHPEAFKILQQYLGGTHQVRSDDLIRTTSLLRGVNYSVSPTLGGADRARTSSPGSRGIATAGSHMSRLVTPATVIGNSSKLHDSPISSQFFPTSEVHSFTDDQQRREHQLTIALHYVHVADVGQLLHELAIRRYFSAAGALVRTTAVNVHQHDDASNTSFTTERPHHSRSVDHRSEHLEVESGVAVIHIAAQFGASSLLKDLVKSGQFLPDEPSRGDGWTPLHFAAANGHIETVDILLKLGVSPRSRTADGKGEGFTPLHLAAQHGHLDVVNCLVDHGAQVDALTGSHRTPLHCACRFGHLAVALGLIDMGCSTEKVDLSGSTAILLAAEHGHGGLILSIVAKAKKEHLLLSLNSKTKVSIAHYAAWFGSSMPKDLIDRLYAVSQAATTSAAASAVGNRPVSAATGNSPATRPQTVSSADEYGLGGKEEGALFPPKQINGSLVEAASASPPISQPAAASVVRASGGALAFIFKASKCPVPALAEAIGISPNEVAGGRAAAGGAQPSLAPNKPYIPVWAKNSSQRRPSLRILSAALNSDSTMAATAPSSTSPAKDRPHALDVLAELFAACTEARRAVSDPTLFPELNGAAEAAGKEHVSILSAYQDSAPASCTAIHLFRHPDNSSPHPWLPVHYALANGQSAVVAQIRRLDPSASVPDIALDQKQFLLDEASRREAAAKANVVVGVQFPKVDVQPIGHLAAEAARVENEVFPLCPPPSPPPQVWHDGYFSNNLQHDGIFGLVRMRNESVSCVSAEAAYRSFAVLNDARVLTNLAWFVQRGMIKEISSRLGLLQDLNVGVGSMYPSGVPLLTIAAYYGQNEAVKVLLAAGADPRHIARLPNTSARLSKGMTALLAAAHVGHLPVIETLLEHGKCDVDAEDECGNTAVHYAVLRKNFTLVKTLLRYGAKIDVKNHAGDAPEDIAIALRSREIIKLIQCWSITSSLQERDRVALHPPCRTAVEYSHWIEETSIFYKRLDMLHQRDVKITNKDELKSIPTLLYRKLSQRLQTPPARSVESQLVPFWWPEEVKQINLQATFLGDKCLGTLFQFTKIVRNLESLVLSSCQVSNEHVADLCYAIEQHPSLRRIDLSFNRNVSKAGGLRVLALCEVNVNIVGVSLEGTSVDVALQRTVNWQTEANRKTQAMRCEDPTSEVHPSSTPTVTPARKRLKDVISSAAPSSKPPSRMSNRTHGETSL